MTWSPSSYTRPDRTDLHNMAVCAGNGGNSGIGSGSSY
jgi:hypothetical protein